MQRSPTEVQLPYLNLNDCLFVPCEHFDVFLVISDLREPVLLDLPNHWFLLGDLSLFSDNPHGKVPLRHLSCTVCSNTRVDKQEPPIKEIFR